MNLIKKSLQDNVAEISYDEMKQVYLVTENYDAPTYIRFHWTVKETGIVCMSPPFLIKSAITQTKDHSSIPSESEVTE